MDHAEDASNIVWLKYMSLKEHLKPNKKIQNQNGDRRGGGMPTLKIVDKIMETDHSPRSLFKLITHLEKRLHLKPWCLPMEYFLEGVFVNL